MAPLATDASVDRRAADTDVGWSIYLRLRMYVAQLVGHADTTGVQIAQHIHVPTVIIRSLSIT